MKKFFLYLIILNILFTNLSYATSTNIIDVNQHDVIFNNDTINWQKISNGVFEIYNDYNCVNKISYIDFNDEYNNKYNNIYKDDLTKEEFDFLNEIIPEFDLIIYSDADLFKFDLEKLKRTYDILLKLFNKKKETAIYDGSYGWDIDGIRGNLKQLDFTIKNYDNNMCIKYNNYKIDENANMLHDNYSLLFDTRNNKINYNAYRNDENYDDFYIEANFKDIKYFDAEELIAPYLPNTASIASISELKDDLYYEVLINGYRNIEIDDSLLEILNVGDIIKLNDFVEIIDRNNGELKYIGDKKISEIIELGLINKFPSDFGRYGKMMDNDNMYMVFEFVNYHGDKNYAFIKLSEDDVSNKKYIMYYGNVNVGDSFEFLPVYLSYKYEYKIRVLKNARYMSTMYPFEIKNVFSGFMGYESIYDKNIDKYNENIFGYRVKNKYFLNNQNEIDKFYHDNDGVSYISFDNKGFCTAIYYFDRESSK